MKNFMKAVVSESRTDSILIGEIQEWDTSNIFKEDTAGRSFRVSSM
jgi:hypothetical protein